jgi:hypothetical protein
MVRLEPSGMSLRWADTRAVSPRHLPALRRRLASPWARFRMHSSRGAAYPYDTRRNEPFFVISAADWLTGRVCISDGE